jgi:hypothetical protein
LLYLVILIAIPISTVVASESEQSISDVAPASTTPFYTFSSGVDRGTLVTISDHGNIIEFKSPNSPGAEYEHIGVGALSEGYILCYDIGGVTYRSYDTGSSEANFGPATTTIKPVSVTRNTIDNVLQLKQIFLFQGIRKMLHIKMTVTNISSLVVNNVILRRQVDFDIDTGGASGWAGFINNHARTSEDGVFAWNDPSAAPVGYEAHGMIMRHLLQTYEVSHVAKVTDGILDNSCSPAAKPTPVLDSDDGETLEYYLGDMAPWESKYVVIAYERF